MRIALIGILAAISLALVGCGGSNDATRIAAEFNDGSCSKDGVEEIAGERETIYTCEYLADHGRYKACMALVEDEVYVVRATEAC